MIKEERIKKLNSHEIKLGPVIYWMNREIRVENNWSLIYAQEIAIKNKQPLIVVYNLVPGFLGGKNRQMTFKIEGLKEVENKLKSKKIDFQIILDETGKNTSKKIISICQEFKSGLLITDFFPLKISNTWINEIKIKVKCAFHLVDSHNIIPAWITSDKKEYAAYTIRPKIFKKIQDYLDVFPKIQKHKYALGDNLSKKIKKINWEKILPLKDYEKLEWIKSGESQAQKVLKDFIENKLDNYATDRNDANLDMQSNLSPYLHYGMISAQDISLQIIEWSGTSIDKIIDKIKNKAKLEKGIESGPIENAGAFLEELIIRRELSDNFCLYEKNYDSFEGFPDWSKKTLNKSRTDKREYIYTKREFENSKTHDDLWNACQNQMVISGKMHGYMRMYWAKKILEWTGGPEEAQRIAIYLNDKYELDGRDPNGYAGIAWSIGGVHDRSWFDREIFGQVRYMARSGCEKKFDVKKYIETWVG